MKTMTAISNCAKLIKFGINDCYIVTRQGHVKRFKWSWQAENYLIANGYVSTDRPDAE